VTTLRTAQRRLGDGQEAQAPGAPGTEGESTPGDDPVVRDPHENKPGPNHAAAAIGSIDIDAVFKRYEKVKTSNEEYTAALSARKRELMKIMDDAQQVARMLSRATPGSDEYKRHENRVTELKARHEAGREQAEREFAQRQARTISEHYGEIHEVVAALAKAKGLNYVVKVSTGPRNNSAPDEVAAALNHSVVYADPRNDLTEEVIPELNDKVPAPESKNAIKRD
jgi:Skp family chaperone for outer membrane proteins